MIRARTIVGHNRHPNGRGASLPEITDEPISTTDLARKRGALENGFETLHQIATAHREDIPGLHGPKRTH